MAISFLSSCASYKQNILFTTENDVIPRQLKQEIDESEGNYIIQANDYLNVNVYTNKGERIIDPDFELISNNTNAIQQTRPKPKYLVNDNGYTKLPIVGAIKLKGYTLLQADSLLEIAYSEYYKTPYVITEFVNKRVIVLGGEAGMVIPLTNENMSVLEVLALAGGIDKEAKGHNIRLIRGDLKDPYVQVIDLTTIEGMKKANLKVLPNDIIYIEPVRRAVPESIKDVSPLVGIFTNLLTLVIVILSI